MAAPSAAPWLTGVCPVLEVPFHDDGEVDHRGFAAVTDHVLATGVRAVMFPGYASEFHKLSDIERDVLTDEVIERCRATAGSAGPVSCVVSVSEHSTLLATRRAAELAGRGADAVNVLPPHRVPVGREGLLTHLRAVLAAVAPLPVVIQHAPVQTGAALSAGDVAALRAEHDNLAAVKVEAVPSGPTVSALASLEPAVPTLVGYAGLQLVDAFDRGAVGVQPGCSFTELYVAVWHLLVAGRRDEAVAQHRRMVPYLAAWMQDVETITAVEKEISRRRGLIASSYCRAPAHHLDRYELALVDDFLLAFATELPGPW